MAAYSYNFPVVITADGPQPTDPGTIRGELVDNVTSTNPDFTADLPASIVEDVTSTEVGGIALMDQARVDTINSLTPNGANEFLLVQIGQMLGIPKGLPTNVSVQVVFQGTVGYVITNGFLISDGSYVYQVQGTGVVGASGFSASMTAIALDPNATVPAANTVVKLVTSVPSTITLSVTNPAGGNPAQNPETWQSYRGRVLQGELAAAVSTGRFVKTLVGQVSGVTPRLIGAQQANPGIRVIVGGTGDKYQIANAILQSVADPTDLVGSAVSSTRNVVVSVSDYPDTYTVTYVTPPAQVVAMTITWNTSLANFAGGGTFQGLVQQPIADYVNALPVGAPINLLEVTAIFQQAVAAQLDPNLLTRLAFSVYVNSVLTPPASGYSSIAGDKEGYFTCLSTAITVNQG